MKTSDYRIALLLSAMAVTAAACSSSDNPSDEPAAPAKFTATAENGNPNFIILKAEGDDSDSYVWSVNNTTLTGRQATCYLEKAGNYEVTLKHKHGNSTGTATKTVTVASDSRYFTNGEKLWWSDDFDKRTIDNTSWNYDLGIGKWGNNEWENYTNKPENVFTRDGNLVIRAIKSGEGQKIGDYTSARLTTRGKREINRGRVEVRAKLPGGRGIWPAIWMYGTKASPYYSELDMMEYVGCDKNIIYGAVHTTSTLQGTEKVSEALTVPDVETAFHIYGMSWTDGRIEYYLDTPDNVYLTFAPGDTSNASVWPFDSEMYLILNVAVGGDWGGMHGVDDSIFPCEMEIDYVRIFKK